MNCGANCPVALAVHAATVAGEPDAWWHYLPDRLARANITGAYTFADREASEVAHLVRVARTDRRRLASLAH